MVEQGSYGQEMMQEGNKHLSLHPSCIAYWSGGHELMIAGSSLDTLQPAFLCLCFITSKTRAWTKWSLECLFHPGHSSIFGTLRFALFSSASSYKQDWILAHLSKYIHKCCTVRLSPVPPPALELQCLQEDTDSEDNKSKWCVYKTCYKLNTMQKFTYIYLFDPYNEHTTSGNVIDSILQMRKLRLRRVTCSWCHS
jgi:hypothetical protein